LLVAPRSTVKRILAALSAFDVADRPMSRLDAARRLREAAEELEAAQVEAARKDGATWLEIGACYGLTKQGAQQRFRAARKQAEAASAAAAVAAVAAETAAGAKAAAAETAAAKTKAAAAETAAAKTKAAADTAAAAKAAGAKAAGGKKAEPAA
jgi:hypothetical protein